MVTQDGVKQTTYSVTEVQPFPLFPKSHEYVQHGVFGLFFRFEITVGDGIEQAVVLGERFGKSLFVSFLQFHA